MPCTVTQVNNDCSANNDAESAAAFFAGMCSPGAAAGAGDNQTITDALCSACVSGQGAEDFCVRGADTYQGYDGALTCLENGAGDIAFIKHTTIAGECGPFKALQQLCQFGQRFTFVCEQPSSHER